MIYAPWNKLSDMGPRTLVRWPLDSSSRFRRQPQNEEDLKNGDDRNNADDLNNEDDLKDEDDQKM